MLISSGMYYRREVSLTEDTDFVRCNLAFCNIITNGHGYTTDSCNTRGLRVNGVKQDAFVKQVTEPLAAGAKIQALISDHVKDIFKAWENVVDVIHSGAADMTYGDFIDAYVSANEGNSIYQAALLGIIKPALPDGWGFVEVRDWINTKTKDQLLGKDTEVVEEIS